MAKSDTILGRRLNRRAFDCRTPFRVSVYITRRGQVRYTDPVVCRPGKAVMYRVIVRAKR